MILQMSWLNTGSTMAAQTHALDLLALPSAFRDIERVCEHLGGAGHLGDATR